MCEGRHHRSIVVRKRGFMPAASAAYLNHALEPTPYSLRSFLASASGRGSPRALGLPARGEKRERGKSSLGSCARRGPVAGLAGVMWPLRLGYFPFPPEVVSVQNRAGEVRVRITRL